MPRAGEVHLHERLRTPGMAHSLVSFFCLAMPSLEAVVVERRPRAPEHGWLGRGVLFRYYSAQKEAKT